MHVNHLITQLLYDWNNLHIYNMGVSVCFEIETFSYFQNPRKYWYDLWGYKKFFLGNSGHLRNHIWAF